MTEAFLTSNDQTWATPWPVIHALEAEGFRFTLDVASGLSTAKASKFYTVEDDAFRQDWARDAAGGDAWCNPPYGDENCPVRDWAKEAWKYRAVLSTVMLLPANKTDQDWFHDLVIPDGEYRPVRGRIGFLDAAGYPVTGNSQGSMLIVFGPKAVQGQPRSFNYRHLGQEVLAL